MKEITSRHMTIKLLKTSKKEKIQKEGGEKKTYYVERSTGEDNSRFLFRNNAIEKTVM